MLTVRKHKHKGVILTRTWETQNTEAAFWSQNMPVLKHSTQALVCKDCGKTLAEPFKR